MTFDLSEYQRIKQKTENARKQAEKAEWERTRLLEQLQEEFACKTPKQAEKRLKEMDGELQEAESEYDQVRSEFLGEFGDELG